MPVIAQCHEDGQRLLGRFFAFVQRVVCEIFAHVLAEFFKGLAYEFTIRSDDKFGFLEACEQDLTCLRDAGRVEHPGHGVEYTREQRRVMTQLVFEHIDGIEVRVTGGDGLHGPWGDEVCLGQGSGEGGGLCDWSFHDELS